MSLLDESVVNAQADALAVMAAGGALRLYEARRLLAELPIEAPAAGVAVGGTIAWRIKDAFALARGVPDEYRIYSAGGQVLETGTVGRYDADLIVSYDVIEKGGRISVTNFVHKVPR